MVTPVHLSYFSLGPDTLKVVDPQLRVSRGHPPCHISTQSHLCVVIEILLFAILFFEVIDVTLIVIDRVDLFTHQVPREVSKQETLNESQDASNEHIWVPLNNRHQVKI